MKAQALGSTSRNQLLQGLLATSPGCMNFLGTRFLPLHSLSPCPRLGTPANLWMVEQLTAGGRPFSLAPRLLIHADSYQKHTGGRLGRPSPTLQAQRTPQDGAEVKQTFGAALSSTLCQGRPAR